MRRFTLTDLAVFHVTKLNWLSMKQTSCPFLTLVTSSVASSRKSKRVLLPVLLTIKYNSWVLTGLLPRAPVTLRRKTKNMCVCDSYLWVLFPLRCETREIWRKIYRKTLLPSPPSLVAWRLNECMSCVYFIIFLFSIRGIFPSFSRVTGIIYNLPWKPKNASFVFQDKSKWFLHEKFS